MSPTIVMHAEVALAIARFVAAPDDVVRYLRALPPSWMNATLMALLSLLETAFPPWVWPVPWVDGLGPEAANTISTALPAFSAVRLTSGMDQCPLALLPETAVALDIVGTWNEVPCDRISYAVQDLSAALGPRPDAIVELSLQLLGLYDDLASQCRILASCVNVRCAQLTWLPEGVESSLDPLVETLGSWPRLAAVHLIVPCAESYAPNALCAWLASSTVSSVALDDMRFTPSAAEVLVDALFASATLARLALRHTPVVASALFRPARRWPPSLQSLKLALAVDECMPMFAVSQLRTAKLQSVNISSNGLVYNAEVICTLLEIPTLTLLALRPMVVHCSLPQVSLHRLRHLDLAGAAFNSAAFASIVALLHSTSELETLGLRRTELTTGQFASLVDAVGLWMGRCGTHLDLSATSLGAAAPRGWAKAASAALPALFRSRVALLASALPSMGKCQTVSFDLRENRLPLDAAKALVTALRHSQNVVLDLADTGRFAVHMPEVEAHARQLGVRVVASSFRGQVFAAPGTPISYHCTRDHPDILLDL
ncbi:hypothetical protein ACHHYP_12731 [Achlya hypogyna]|uniref:Uncharacterized protein n=1 Tax=Achlya hypogyna TaxID=1202772 RepID=A0A1V9ZGE1_ACHHY|nr:hypothetical protein ACHHYP_12731 [Achlya hypogyna]